MTVFPTLTRLDALWSLPQYSAESRPTRVVVLLLGVTLLSLADLHLTLTHIRHFGLAEANPIAIALFEMTGCSSSLALLKLATLTIAVASLYVIRRTRAAEIGAWICLGILTALGVWWLRYNEAVMGDELLGPLMKQSGHALLLTG